MVVWLTQTWQQGEEDVDLRGKGGRDVHLREEREGDAYLRGEREGVDLRGA